MEKVEICSIHKKLREIYCTTCKVFLCNICLTEHCKIPSHPASFMHVFDYASACVVPTYDDAIKKIANDQAKYIESGREITPRISNIIQLLKAIITKLEIALKAINTEMPKLCSINKCEEIMKETTSAITTKKQELIDSIKRANAEQVVKICVNSQKMFVDEIIPFGDRDKSMVEALENEAKAYLEYVKGDKLIELLNMLSSRFQKNRCHYLISAFPPAEPFPYIYMNIGRTTNFCVYNIAEEKISKPFQITGVSGRHTGMFSWNDKIYVFNGAGCCNSNIAAEFTVSTDFNFTRKDLSPMIVAKCAHTLYTFDGEVIYSIGGYKGGNITSCEKYLVSANKWETIKPLNNADCFVTVAVICNQYLISVPCRSNGNKIEKYDTSANSAWENIALKQTLPTLDANYGTCITVSNDEIIFFKESATYKISIKNGTLEQIGKQDGRSPYNDNESVALKYNNKLYYACQSSKILDVYDLQTFKKVEEIKLEI